MSTQGAPEPHSVSERRVKILERPRRDEVDTAFWQPSLRTGTALGVVISFFFEGLEAGAPVIDPQLGDILADKEALMLVRSYYAIPEAQRRRLFDLAKVLSDAA